MRHVRAVSVLISTFLILPFPRGISAQIFDREFDRTLREVRSCAAAGAADAMCPSLETAVARIRAAAGGPVRRMMAAGLYSCCPASNPATLAAVQALLPEYIPVLASGGDADQPPSLQAVARGDLILDDGETLTGIRGPRLQVLLPERITVRVAPFSLVSRETVVNPLREAGPARQAVELPLRTAFVAGNRILEAAERWVGHRVQWGRGGRLSIFAFSSVTDAPLAFFDRQERQVNLGALGSVSTAGIQGFTGTPYGWAMPVKGLWLDTVGDPDAAAHEAAHAVVNALKPGWGVGVSGALHEALADAMTVLTSFEDPSVMERVLAQTGGDLQRPNEAALLCERMGGVLNRGEDADPSNDSDRSIRSVLGCLRPEECGLSREAVDMPERLSYRLENADPHHIGKIVSCLLYEVFCSLVREEGSDGSPADRLLRAQDTAGALMLQSLRYLGEHRVSLRDYAFALLRVDLDSFQRRHRMMLRTVLASRGLIDEDEDLDGELCRLAEGVPEFRLDPGVTGIVRIKAILDRWEDQRIAAAVADGCLSTPLMRHSGSFPFCRYAEAAKAELCGDASSCDGYRTLRLHYRVSSRRLLPDQGFGSRDQPDSRPEAFPGELDVYSSLVFDAAGKLVSLHVDRPWPPELDG